MTTSDYLTQLQQDRDDLVDNLEAKGITGLTGDETFTELVPEVLNIPSGGGDISEYLNLTIDYNTQNSTYTKDLIGFRSLKKAENVFVANNVTSLLYAFFYQKELTSVSFAPNSAINVTNMGAMFQDCPKLSSLDLTNLNTSKVTTMAGMFYACIALTNLDLRTMDTSNVTDMERRFYGCTNLTSLNISGANTSKVKNMGYMFQECGKLPTIGLENLDTSSVTNMQYMFNNCYNLTNLDLSSFNTSLTTNMQYMFSGCSKLEHLDIRNFTFDNVASKSGIFNSIPTNCEIIVKSQTEKDWVLTQRSALTNVKTVEEYEIEHTVIRLPLDTIESAGDGGVLFDSTHTHGISEWAEAITIINSVDVGDTLLFTLYDTNNNLNYTYLGYKSSNNVFIFGDNEQYEGDVETLTSFMFDSYRIVISDNKYNVYFESSHMSGQHD